MPARNVAYFTFRARSLLQSLKTSMAVARSVHGALAPFPAGDDLVPGECMDTKCFGGASSLRDLRRGRAEDTCHDARFSRCWQFASTAHGRARAGRGRVSRAADPLVVPFAPAAASTSWRASSASAGRPRQQVVVENRPGAGGNIGSRRSREARPTATPCCSRSPAPSAINPSSLRQSPLRPGQGLRADRLVADSPSCSWRIRRCR